MKQFRLLLLAATMAALSSCGGNTERFAGRWRSLDRATLAGAFIIEEKGDTFLMRQEGASDKAMPFTYDAKGDVLTTSLKGQVIELHYDDATKHLLMTPQGGSGGLGPQSVAFEREEP